MKCSWFSFYDCWFWHPPSCHNFFYDRNHVLNLLPTHPLTDCHTECFSAAKAALEVQMSVRLSVCPSISLSVSLKTHVMKVRYTSVIHHWKCQLKGYWLNHINTPRPNQINVRVQLFNISKLFMRNLNCDFCKYKATWMEYLQNHKKNKH